MGNSRLVSWTLILLGININFNGVCLVRLVSLHIPSHVLKGSEVRLDCHFDLEGESLYSVKWYKDNREFYRFLPEDNPPAQAFDIPGFRVEMRNSTDTSLLLRNVDFEGSGFFRCEITGEAPSFQSVTKSEQMLVVEIPKDGPIIEGSKSSRYKIGDLLRVNCTSSHSQPPAKLSWFINQELAGPKYVSSYPETVDKAGLESAKLGLEFEIRPEHFRGGGDLKIKCLATIGNIYWRTYEESFEAPDRISPNSIATLESRGILTSSGLKGYLPNNILALTAFIYKIHQILR